MGFFKHTSKIVGDRIKFCRNAAGYSVYKCAKSIGVSHSTWQSWEDGTYEPKIENIVKIAEILNCKVSYLMIGAEIPDEVAQVIRTRNKKVTRVDVIDYVPAGDGFDEPVPMDEYFEIPFDEKEGSVVALRITGESMEPDYQDGDYVFVSEVPVSRIKSGEAYVLITQDGKTLKTVFKEKDHFLFVPRNESVRPKRVTEIYKAFRVKYLFRKK